MSLEGSNRNLSMISVKRVCEFVHVVFSYWTMLGVDTLLKTVMSYSRHYSRNHKMSLIKLFWVGKASALGGSWFRSERGVQEVLKFQKYPQPSGV
jgi:hypothetical protein